MSLFIVIKYHTKSNNKIVTIEKKAGSVSSHYNNKFRQTNVLKKFQLISQLVLIDLRQAMSGKKILC